MTAVIPFVVIALCALPWVLLASRRWGHLFGVPAVAVLAVLLVLGAMILGRLLGLGILVSTGVVVIAMGVLGAVLIVRSGAWRRPSRHAVAVWAPAMVGALAWCVAFAVAQVLPGAARLSWALNGDANNNLFFAGRIIDQHGVALGVQENPVPLPAALLALGLQPMWPEDPIARLEHSFVGLGAVWVVLLAAVALGMGAVAASLIDRSRLDLVAVASAAGSLLPLTWFVAGLPIEYGYFNAHLVIPLALASWLIYLAVPTRPVIGIALQLCTATLMLATWSPWVVLPLALGLAQGMSQWSALRSITARTGWPLIIALLPLLCWLFLVSAPALAALGDAFQIPGHGLPGVIPVAVIVLVLLVLGAVLLRRRLAVMALTSRAEIPPPVLSAAIATTTAIVSGSGTLLFLARDSDPLTAYYPAKFFWLSTVIVGIIAASVFFALVALSRRPLLGIAVGTLVILVAASLGPPLKRPGFVIRPPVTRLLAGAVWASGDRSAELILANSDPSDPGILWASGEPDEAFIDFWIALKLGGELGADSAGYSDGDPTLRGFAFAAYRQYRDTGSWMTPPVGQLCDVIQAIGGSVRVVTADPELEQSLNELCPALEAQVE
ncbi:MAG: hypothetical protein ACRCSP_06785, partial [Rhodoglobus sp.]